MIEVLLADSNGEPHPALYGRTPLEAMQLSVGQHRDRIRFVPLAARPSICLLHDAVSATVRGRLHDGVRPYINFCHVRYTSPLLATSPALIGKKLRIYFNPRDIRVVRAFFDDGAELGVLSAARPWNITPHSLKVRRDVFKALEERKLEIREGDNPIEAWVRMRMSKDTGKATTVQLAKQQRLEESTAANDTDDLDEPYIALSRSTASVPSPAPDSVGEAHKEEEKVDVAVVTPKVLSVRKTLTF
jgi:putative transposase